MAHAASFVLLVSVMRLTRELRQTRSINRPIALLGLSLAATFLVRPQQIIVGVFLLPALFRIVRSRPRTDWVPGMIIGAVICFSAVAVQVGMNFLQLGKATLSGYSVGGEGFHFFDPNLSIVLISSSRGLFFFSPVVGFAAVGYIWHARSIPRYVWPQVCNAVAQVYLISVWSSPEQGDAFGCRMFGDNAAVIAVGLAALFHRSPRPWRWVAGSIIFAAVCWTMFLMARYMGFID